MDDESSNHYGSVLSAAQHRVRSPLSLGKATTGSVAQRTAWRSNEGDTPSAYSAKTSGSTLNWDDAPAASLPKSDTGASFGGA